MLNNTIDLAIKNNNHVTQPPRKSFSWYYWGSNIIRGV